MLGADDGTANGRHWERECEVIWQWERQYCCAGSERNFMGRRVTSINDQWGSLKFEIFSPILINTSADNDTKICPHLLGRAFPNCDNAFGCGSCADSNIFGNIFHCGSQPIGLSNRAFHGLGLFGGGVNGYSQLISLITKDQQLKDSDGSEYPGSGNKGTGKLNQFPIIRRFFCAIFGLLGGFIISLWGWKLFDNKRHGLGTALILGDWLLGASGLILLCLANYPLTLG